MSFPHVDERTAEKLKALGIEAPLPIQAQCLEFLMHDPIYRNCKGANDVCIKAPTGQGKTLCYVLPVVLRELQEDVLACLVVTPTRELAEQTYKVFTHFDKHCICLLTGNRSITEERDELTKAQVVVSTPGRLMEHAITDTLRGRKLLNLDRLRWLVLDEYDVVVSDSAKWFDVFTKILPPRKTVPSKQERDLAPKMYFLNDTIERPQFDMEAFTTEGFNNIRPERMSYQIIILSATLRDETINCCPMKLHQPEWFQEGQTELKVSDQVETIAVKKESHMDLGLLVRFLCGTGCKKFMVFCNAQGAATATARQLREALKIRGKVVRRKWRSNIPAAAGQEDSVLYDSDPPCVSVYTGGVDFRAQTILEFRNADKAIMVCSDLAARGIDVPDVDAVISVDTPATMEVFLHRSGRCGRGLNSGASYSLYEGPRQFGRLLHFMNSTPHPWGGVVLHWDAARRLKKDSSLPSERCTRPLPTWFALATRQLKKDSSLPSERRFLPRSAVWSDGRTQQVASSTHTATSELHMYILRPLSRSRRSVSSS